MYLLMHWMDLVDTLHDVRYWSKVVFCTNPTPYETLRSGSQTKKFHVDYFILVSHQKSFIFQLEIPWKAFTIPQPLTQGVISLGEPEG